MTCLKNACEYSRYYSEKVVAALLKDGYCFGRSSINSAITAVQRGEMVVIVDDHDQENDRITNAVQFLLLKISRVKESIDMYMGLRKKYGWKMLR